MRCQAIVAFAPRIGDSPRVAYYMDQIRLNAGKKPEKGRIRRALGRIHNDPRGGDLCKLFVQDCH
jgi:hypothetical protein